MLAQDEEEVVPHLDECRRDGCECIPLGASPQSRDSPSRSEFRQLRPFVRGTASRSQLLQGGRCESACGHFVLAVLK